MGNSITPPGGPPPGVASGYTCGYGNRSPRVAARSLKVDNGPVAWPSAGPRRVSSGAIKRAGVPVPAPPRRAVDRAIDRGENYCLKIRSTDEMLMKTLPAGPTNCVIRGRQRHGIPRGKKTGEKTVARRSSGAGSHRKLMNE